MTCPFTPPRESSQGGRFYIGLRIKKSAQGGAGCVTRTLEMVRE